MENLRTKILFIEDDVIDQLGFKRLVRDENLKYDYVIADSVASAKEILSKDVFDLIILDYSLGDGTAFDLMDFINDTPIVFATGAGDEETAVKAMKYDVHDYLIKDVERNYIKLLPSIIAEAINNKNEREQFRMLSHAMENINDMVYITDCDYNIKFVNNSFRNFYKYSDNEIIGKKSSILWNSEEDFLYAVKTLCKEGTGTFLQKTKDDKIIPVEISRSFIKDKRGNYTDIVNVVRDITDKIEYEKRIIQERDKAQSYLNIAEVAIITLDKEGNIQLINKKGVELFGYDEDYIINKNIFDNFIADSTKEEEKKLFEDIMVGHKESKGYHESCILTKCRDERIIGWYTTLLKDDNGNIKGMLISGEDITKRIEIDKMKTEFVNTVSHEIRTPLTVVLALAQLLMHSESIDKEKTKKYYNTIYKESKRLSQLVNDFLDIQRMESGRQAFNKEKISILDAIDDVVELYETSETHDIVLDLDKGYYSDIHADYLKIKQLITNLVSNAIKYSPDNKEIAIKVREKDNFIHVSVIDNGLGIPEESIPMLFTKFYRVDNSDHRKVGGTGLGLVICKDIITAHSGDIGVNSQLGKGSEFYFCIPVMEN